MQQMLQLQVSVHCCLFLLIWHGEALLMCSCRELGPGDVGGGGTGTLKYGRSPAGIPHWRGSSTRVRHRFPAVFLSALSRGLIPAEFCLYQASLIFLQRVLGSKGELFLLQALLLRCGDLRMTCPRYCHPSFKCKSRWLMYLHRRCPSGVKVMFEWSIFQQSGFEMKWITVARLTWRKEMAVLSRSLAGIGLLLWREK